MAISDLYYVRWRTDINRSSSALFDLKSRHVMYPCSKPLDCLQTRCIGSPSYANSRILMLVLTEITFHACRRDSAACRTLISCVMGFLLLGLYGCTSVAPQHTAPKSFDVPVAWSVANVSGSTGASSLTQWWSSFNDPLLTSLVAQALQSGTSVKSAQAALQQ